MNSKLVLCLALVLSGVLSGCSTNSPQSTSAVLPRMSLPTNLISSVNFLFNLGLADPRGCDYREFETTFGSGFGNTYKVSAHGWILPARSGRKQVLAVGWDGLVYPAVRIGKKVSLRQDIESLLRADELWRKSARTSGFNYRVLWMEYSTTYFMSQSNMTAIKIALLLRLGEGKLAQEYWHDWRAVECLGESKEDAGDPFRELASEWAYVHYNRAVSAFMCVDDALALADFRLLNRGWPELENEASRRGFRRPPDYQGTARPYFEFLELVPELLADEERRAIEPPRPSVLQIGLDKFPDQSSRIAALISNLDQVNERQYMFPGGVSLGDSSIVTALVAEGDGAVEPLLDCLEKDTRLTRSAHLSNNFQPDRIIPVRDCARSALDEILKMHCESPAEYRAYWQKYRSTLRLERWYLTLLDDQAGRKQWTQAAQDILARTDGKEFYYWRNAPMPNANNQFTYVAETLRSKTSPSIADLFLKRALEIAPTNYNSSEDCGAFADAANLSLMLAEWDATNAASALGKIIRRCPVFFCDQRTAWTSGCGVVPEQFARLAVALADLGDTTGLDLYAKWVRDRSLSDLDGALPTALSPCWRFPNHPSIKEASANFFRPQNGAWLRKQGFCDLLKTRLPLNEPFRLLILGALTDKTKGGTIVLGEKGQFEIRGDNGSEGGILEPDAFAPKIGQLISFRVCDDVARRLSRIEGLPVLRLYWPESKRDEAVAAVLKFLRENGDSLILKPENSGINDGD